MKKCDKFVFLQISAVFETHQKVFIKKTWACAKASAYDRTSQTVMFPAVNLNQSPWSNNRDATGYRQIALGHLHCVFLCHNRVLKRIYTLQLPHYQRTICSKLARYIKMPLCLNGWVFFYELNGCGFKFLCSSMPLLAKEMVINTFPSDVNFNVRSWNYTLINE